MKPRSNSNLVLIAALYFLAGASSFAQTTTGYLISGRVIDESQQGVEKVRVCAKPEDYNQVPMVSCNLSDANGNFAIHTGRAAHFTIFPEKTAAGYQWQAVPFYRNPSMPLIEVVLTESNQTASVSVSLGPKNGALVGRVTDGSTGKPIENARFTMCQAAAPEVCFNQNAKNTAGAFDIGAALIPFTLKITADGYEDWWGLSGVDKNIPISVASGAKVELLCLMKRKPETANRQMSEAEKLSAVNLPAPIQLARQTGQTSRSRLRRWHTSRWSGSPYRARWLTQWKLISVTAETRTYESASIHSHSHYGRILRPPVLSGPATSFPLLVGSPADGAFGQ